MIRLIVGFIVCQVCLINGAPMPDILPGIKGGFLSIEAGNSDPSNNVDVVIRNTDQADGSSSSGQPLSLSLPPNFAQALVNFAPSLTQPSSNAAQQPSRSPLYTPQQADTDAASSLPIALPLQSQPADSFGNAQPQQFAAPSSSFGSSSFSLLMPNNPTASSPQSPPAVDNNQNIGFFSNIQQAQQEPRQPLQESQKIVNGQLNLAAAQILQGAAPSSISVAATDLPAAPATSNSGPPTPAQADAAALNAPQINPDIQIQQQAALIQQQDFAKQQPQTSVYFTASNQPQTQIPVVLPQPSESQPFRSSSMFAVSQSSQQQQDYSSNPQSSNSNTGNPVSIFSFGQLQPETHIPVVLPPPTQFAPSDATNSAQQQQQPLFPGFQPPAESSAAPADTITATAVSPPRALAAETNSALIAETTTVASSAAPETSSSLAPQPAAASNSVESSAIQNGFSLLSGINRAEISSAPAVKTSTEQFAISAASDALSSAASPEPSSSAPPETPAAPVSASFASNTIEPLFLASQSGFSLSGSSNAAESSSSPPSAESATASAQPAAPDATAQPPARLTLFGLLQNLSAQTAQQSSQQSSTAFAETIPSASPDASSPAMSETTTTAASSAAPTGFDTTAFRPSPQIFQLSSDQQAQLPAIELSSGVPSAASETLASSSPAPETTATSQASTAAAVAETTSALFAQPETPATTAAAPTAPPSYVFAGYQPPDDPAETFAPTQPPVTDATTTPAAAPSTPSMEMQMMMAVVQQQQEKINALLAAQAASASTSAPETTTTPAATTTSAEPDVTTPSAMMMKLQMMMDMMQQQQAQLDAMKVAATETTTTTTTTTPTPPSAPPADTIMSQKLETVMEMVQQQQQMLNAIMAAQTQTQPSPHPPPPAEQTVMVAPAAPEPTMQAPVITMMPESAKPTENPMAAQLQTLMDFVRQAAMSATAAGAPPPLPETTTEVTNTAAPVTALNPMTIKLQMMMDMLKEAAGITTAPPVTTTIKPPTTAGPTMAPMFATMMDMLQAMMRTSGAKNQDVQRKPLNDALDLGPSPTVINPTRDAAEKMGMNVYVKDHGGEFAKNDKVTEDKLFGSLKDEYLYFKPYGKPENIILNLPPVELPLVESTRQGDTRYFLQVLPEVHKEQKVVSNKLINTYSQQNKLINVHNRNTVEFLKTLNVNTDYVTNIQKVNHPKTEVQQITHIHNRYVPKLVVKHSRYDTINELPPKSVPTVETNNKIIELPPVVEKVVLQKEGYDQLASTR